MTTGLRYDPLDTATLRDPYPVYARLREHAPVQWHATLNCWLLTAYDDCLAVVHDHDRFARDRRRVGADIPEAQASLQTMDPPEQTPVRRLYLSALRRFDHVGLRQLAGLWLTELIALVDRDAEFDFMASVAVPFSLRVSCHLLGVLTPDPREFARDADAIVMAMDANRDGEVYRYGIEARGRINLLIESWLDDPAPDSLVSRVRGPGVAGSIPEHHIHNTLRVMLLSGYMAMSSCIGNVLYPLLAQPALARQLQVGRSLHTGVDELLRFDSPVTGTTRFAIQDVELGGRLIRRGDGVLALYAAANRDPAKFPDPDTLMLDRLPNSHFGYSWGPHACIGRTVAQGLLEDLVSNVVSLPRQLALAADPVRRPSATLRGLSSLPVMFQ